MLDYGNADIDIRHQLEFDYVYSLPSVPRIPKVLGGGWQMNGITTMRGGEPYSISCSLRPLQLRVRIPPSRMSSPVSRKAPPVIPSAQDRSGFITFRGSVG